MKKIMLLGGIVAALVPASSAMAASGGGSCQLDGTATFKNPLTVNQPTPKPSVPGGFEFPQEVNWGPAFGYTFNGTLSNCKAGGPTGPATVPAGGKIYAGENITIDGVAYRWPLAQPSGSGGCTGSHTDGLAVVIWDDKSASVIDYSTDGAAAAVGLTGNFNAGSLTLTSVATDDQGHPLSTKSFSSLRFAGDYTGGPLAFEPPDPTACNAGGVTSAGIQGVIGRGNYA